MNAATLQASLLANDLAMARSNAVLARSHLAQVRTVAAVTGGIDLQPINLADHYFAEALRHLDRALGPAPLVENPVNPVQKTSDTINTIPHDFSAPENLRPSAPSAVPNPEPVQP